MRDRRDSWRQVRSHVCPNRMIGRTEGSAVGGSPCDIVVSVSRSDDSHAMAGPIQYRTAFPVQFSTHDHPNGVDPNRDSSRRVDGLSTMASMPSTPAVRVLSYHYLASGCSATDPTAIPVRRTATIRLDFVWSTSRPRDQCGHQRSVASVFIPIHLTQQPFFGSQLDPQDADRRDKNRNPRAKPSKRHGSHHETQDPRINGVAGDPRA